MQEKEKCVGKLVFLFLVFNFLKMLFA